MANRASSAHEIRPSLCCLWVEKAFISLADVSEDHHLYGGYDDAGQAVLQVTATGSLGRIIETLSIFRLVIIVDLCFSSFIC